MMTNKGTPRFRIGNGYDTGYDDDDWFWDMQSQQAFLRIMCYDICNTTVIQISKTPDVARARFTE